MSTRQMMPDLAGAQNSCNLLVLQVCMLSDLCCEGRT